MNRRSFLGQLIGGVAASAAVRTWPFKVYSFPDKIEISYPDTLFGKLNRLFNQEEAEIFGLKFVNLETFSKPIYPASHPLLIPTWTVHSGDATYFE